MGDLHEIVDVAAVSKLFLLLAVVGPIAGLLLGALVGARRQALRRDAVTGLLVGMLGPLNLLMWRVYNILTDRNGLDTVRNLAINGILFVVVGAVIGVCIGLAGKSRVRLEQEGEPENRPTNEGIP